MPFIAKQPMVCACTGSVIEPRTRTLENGSTEVYSRDAAELLPPVTNYDLNMMLKAGVNLERVNTKIFDGKRSFVLPLSNDEVNDEK